MANLKDTDPMPFGKYKGTAMANVPASYLLWAFSKWTKTPHTEAILGYIKDNLVGLNQESQKEEENKRLSKLK